MAVFLTIFLLIVPFIHSINVAAQCSFVGDDYHLREINESADEPLKYKVTEDVTAFAFRDPPIVNKYFDITVDTATHELLFTPKGLNEYFDDESNPGTILLEYPQLVCGATSVNIVGMDIKVLDDNNNPPKFDPPVDPFPVMSPIVGAPINWDSSIKVTDADSDEENTYMSFTTSSSLVELSHKRVPEDIAKRLEYYEVYFSLKDVVNTKDHEFKITATDKDNKSYDLTVNLLFNYDIDSPTVTAERTSGPYFENKVGNSVPIATAKDSTPDDELTVTVDEQPFDFKEYFEDLTVLPDGHINLKLKKQIESLVLKNVDFVVRFVLRVTDKAKNSAVLAVVLPFAPANVVTFDVNPFIRVQLTKEGDPIGDVSSMLINPSQAVVIYKIVPTGTSTRAGQDDYLMIDGEGVITSERKNSDIVDNQGMTDVFEVTISPSPTESDLFKPLTMLVTVYNDPDESIIPTTTMSSTSTTEESSSSSTTDPNFSSSTTEPNSSSSTTEPNSSSSTTDPYSSSSTTDPNSSSSTTDPYSSSSTTEPNSSSSTETSSSSESTSSSSTSDSSSSSTETESTATGSTDSTTFGSTLFPTMETTEACTCPPTTVTPVECTTPTEPIDCSTSSSTTFVSGATSETSTTFTSVSTSPVTPTDSSTVCSPCECSTTPGGTTVTTISPLPCDCSSTPGGTSESTFTPPTCDCSTIPGGTTGSTNCPPAPPCESSSTPGGTSDDTTLATSSSTECPTPQPCDCECRTTQTDNSAPTSATDPTNLSDPPLSTSTSQAPELGDGDSEDCKKAGLIAGLAVAAVIAVVASVLAAYLLYVLKPWNSSYSQLRNSNGDSASGRQVDPEVAHNSYRSLPSDSIRGAKGFNVDSSGNINGGLSNGSVGVPAVAAPRGSIFDGDGGARNKNVDAPVLDPVFISPVPASSVFSDPVSKLVDEHEPDYLYGKSVPSYAEIPSTAAPSVAEPIYARPESEMSIPTSSSVPVLPDAEPEPVVEPKVDYNRVTFGDEVKVIELPDADAEEGDEADDGED